MNLEFYKVLLRMTPDQNLLINPQTGQPIDARALMQRIVDLQDQLIQAQEKNLLLSAQARELERSARDADDIRGEMAAQGVLLADKSRENKQLHQELTKVTTILDTKIQEVEELRAQVTDLQHQLKTREQERDLLAVMLNEAENNQRRLEAAIQELTAKMETKDKEGFFKGFKK